MAGRWNRLMNSLPRLMDGKNDLFEIAERFELPFEEVHAYVQKWIAHGLAQAE
jgi:aminopeptidase-like protein